MFFFIEGSLVWMSGVISPEEWDFESLRDWVEGLGF